ncbi:MAG: cbb3-type cytochrome c oxidase subunit II [Thermoanaerobaculia bacterium]
MEDDLRGAWRGLLTIAATYVAFLLFAQFGFLSQLQRDLGDAGLVRAAMAAMGIGGLAASLGAAWLLGRVPGPRLVRFGLGAVAAVAAVSVVCHGFASLIAVAAGIGVSLGVLTVSVAASLPEIVPPRVAGRVAGLGTGLAYLVSNVPALFEAGPEVRALVPAGLAVIALALAPRGEAVGVKEDRPAGVPAFLRLLAVFLVLIWLDSAAFAIVQANPELKAQTWGSDTQKLAQGAVHLAAAVGAGALLDAGFGLAVPLAAWVLFAVAFPLLQGGGGGAVAAGPLYAVGISLYSTALVVMPSRSGSARWRAGLLYGVAGWIGSALGVGMAMDLGRIPGVFLVVTGVVLAVANLDVGAGLAPAREGVNPSPTLLKMGVLFGPALAIGGIISLGIAGATAPPPEAGHAAAVARGRQVYLQEGCIHCHSQYVRPGTYDVAWWGPSRPLDRSEHPPLVGTRRQGPDLLAVGNRRSEVWHEAHLRDPRRLNPGSRMPSYERLFAGDGQRGHDLVAYLGSLGAGTAVERWQLTAGERIAPRAASAARGAALFAGSCAECHGRDGRGDGPLAASLNDPYVNLRKPGFHSIPRPDDAAIARVIRHGLPPTSMPGHEWLSDQQVADLAAYVKTLPKEIG